MVNETGIVTMETFIILTDGGLPTPTVRDYGKIQTGQTLGTLSIIETYLTENDMINRLTALGVTFDETNAFGYDVDIDNI